MANSIPMMMSLFCFFIGFSSFLWTSHGAPLSMRVLRIGEVLNSTTLLVSPSREFTLGFNSGYLILKSKNNQTYWVGNPDAPMSSQPSTALLTLTKAVLQITGDGNNSTNLYSSPDDITDVVASLSDSGNLVLHEVDHSTSFTQQSRVLWQSSDWPSVALRPGMKLRSNLPLYSWVESENSPRPGSFRLHWNSLRHELQITKDNFSWWNSGEDSYGSFQYIYDVPSYSLSGVSNKHEDYFSYKYNQNATSVWVLHTDGELYDVENNVSIVRAGECDGYNTDIAGCQRWNGRATGDFEMCVDGFSFKPISMNIPINSTWVDTNQSRYYGSAQYCKATCWVDNNCLGFDFLFDNQTGCRFWSVKYYKFVEDPDSSATQYILPSYLPKPSPKINDVHANDEIHKWIGIGAGIAAFLLVLVLCSVWYLIQKRKLTVENQTKIQDMLHMMNSNRPGNAYGLQSHGKGGHDLSVFRYKSIISATCSFSDKNKLGEGGFGPVYKGRLLNGQEIAVKRLSKCSGQGISEFKNELILIYELQHTNLVQLFGFCIHGEERMLIYEYMRNKSLDYFLFDSTRCQKLDWKKRFNIIEGIAQGLVYLHRYSRLRIIHRDLKASNILLDENMNPKISDFGLARIFAHDEQEANTMKIVGTRGYMPPEYVMGGNFSMKSDVYSFGVLMLEILSGRKNNSFYNDDHAINLVGYAWALWKEGAGLGLMDQSLTGSCDKHQFLRCIHVGLLCVEENAASRPTMLDVIYMLTNESLSLPLPTKPAFCTEKIMSRSAVCVHMPEMVASINGISNSDFDGR